MRRMLALVALALLAGCSSPQQATTSTTPVATTMPATTTHETTVDSLHLRRLTLPATARPNEAVNATAEIVNKGIADEATTVVLVVDGETVDRTTVHVAAGSFAEVSFSFTPTVQGTLNVTMRLPTGEALPPRTLVVAAPAATNTTGTQLPPENATAAVAIAGFAFDPPTLQVAAGANVTWTNADPAGHTATATGGAFDSGRLGEGEAFSFVFGTPGTFGYECSFHPSMKGAIVVT